MTATKDDIITLSLMLKDMYIELFGSDATEEISIYITEIVRCFNDPKQQIFIDDNHKGFFIVVDETEPMTPSLKRYNGTRVYIKPEYRNGRVLKEFYDTIFSEYPDGDILGVTLVQSKHIAILEKRHTRIANMYILNRSK